MIPSQVTEIISTASQQSGNLLPLVGKFFASGSVGGLFILVGVALFKFVKWAILINEHDKNMSSSFDQLTKTLNDFSKEIRAEIKLLSKEFHEDRKEVRAEIKLLSKEFREDRKEIRSEIELLSKEFREDRNEIRSEIELLSKEFREDIKEIRTDIKTLLLYQLPHESVKATSPLQLTEKGKTISEGFSAAELAKRIAETLKGEVEGKADYDLQAFCFDYARSRFKPDDVLEARIKQVAYDNGVDILEVQSVLAIELRNVLMKLR